MSDSVSTFFTSLLATIEFAKAVYAFNKTTEINQEIAPLLEMILSMENNVLTMKSFIHKLEEENETYRKELMELKDWGKIKAQYKLIEVAPGIRAQVRKGTDSDNIKKVEWMCPACFNKRIEAPLQREYDFETSGSYICPECKFPYRWEDGSSFAHADIAPSFGEY